MELIEVMCEAMSRGDREKIRTTAHALKSSSGNVGADSLVEMCRSMEIAARDNQFENMSDQLTAVRQEHVQVLEALTEWSQS